ncbi:MAG: 6-phosphofructokinase, partial [Clostridia bacterium]|nr:6-phosphofructokinase [Clostridia bacterium]
ANAAKDAFGHTQLGGLASFLASHMKAATGAKVRGIELSLLQRCAAHSASQTDIDESFAAGKAAVDNAVASITDKMVGFERSYDANGNYVCNIKLFELTDVANTEKKVPLEWITETGDGLTKDFIDYALPLIQGETQLPKENSLPRFVHLAKVKAEPLA